MRIFYSMPDGEVIVSARPGLRDVSDLVDFFLPETIVLEDTKQVAIRESVFGKKLTESYYIFRGYSVRFI